MVSGLLVTQASRIIRVDRADTCCAFDVAGLSEQPNVSRDNEGTSGSGRLVQVPIVAHATLAKGATLGCGEGAYSALAYSLQLAEPLHFGEVRNLHLGTTESCLPKARQGFSLLARAQYDVRARIRNAPYQVIGCARAFPSLHGHVDEEVRVHDDPAPLP